MTTFSGKYLGNKRCEVTHVDSGTTIITDAPKDNGGEGRAFSPTDLFAASLGVCQMTVMAIFAERSGIDLTGMWMNSEKHMSSTPRMVSTIKVEIHLPSKLTDTERQKLEHVSKTCPVHHSLNASIKVQQSFIYDL